MPNSCGATSECRRSYSPTRDYFVPLLGEVLSSSTFRRHEFQEEVIPKLAFEAEQAAGKPLILGFDQMTQTAFRHRQATSMPSSRPTRTRRTSGPTPRTRVSSGHRAAVRDPRCSALPGAHCARR
ncbi:hypothetical protein V8E36_005167 [Tilletia maclaganii]